MINTKENIEMNDSKYILVMFPYPSGSKLHVGHYYNYAIMDSYCRYLKYKGETVFQPFGYDSFGLPAENYAKSIGGDPRTITYENIEQFRIQMKEMNTNYEELLITSDESYQVWTKWIFTQLHNKGLAYKKISPVNYCNKCETVLANEQVVNNKCDRCNSDIEVKELNQWFFKITEYKDRLIKNLDIIDYPEKTKKQQFHWLNKLQDWCVSRQRKWGCPIPIDGETDTLDTFVDSSFYFIRYCDPTNNNILADKSKIKQVDLYVGGSEHSTKHLIYSRFINMFLYDIGITPFEEPFKKLIHQGMITHNGEKMSKSKGNVVNPDGYDPDILRLYLMFIGHYFDGGDWSDKNIKGIERFINKLRIWLTNEDASDTIENIGEFESKINDYVIKFKFNKVISEFMILVNENKSKKLNLETKNRLINLLKCFAPRIII
jgi:leucyl-tRNA synthetase